MSPTKSASTTPLSERSPNKSSPTKSSHQPGEKLALKPMPRFDEKLALAMENNKHQAADAAQGQGPTYISPSDAIRSPTTKKLSEIKGRRFMKGKPQSLFAKTLAAESLKSQSRARQEMNQNPSTSN